MTAQPSEVEELYEARREAAPAVFIAVLVLVSLALVSRHEGWQLLAVHWWTWLLLAIPGSLLCADLWLGKGGVRVLRTRATALVLLGVIVVGNTIGLALLIAGLVRAQSPDLTGAQLLFTAAAIWIVNVIVFGIVYWDLDDGGPFRRTRSERRAPDFQFPQDENPQLAREDWRPRVWDYLYVSLTAGSAFSPTDTMPLTLPAKLLVGIESVVSLVIVVLVTARAVNVLGS